MKIDNNYDVIFIFSYFRIHSYALNIAKHLSHLYRIGFLLINRDNKSIQKLYHTNAEFIAACKEYNVDFINEVPKNRVSTRLLCLPLGFDYGEDFLRSIRLSIQYEKCVALQCIIKPLYGIKEYCSILKGDTIIIFDDAIYNSQVKNLNLKSQISNLNKLYASFPYIRHRAWDSDVMPEFDYMIAMPTEMLADPISRVKLSKSLYLLVSKLKKKYNIVVKHHNVVDGGNVLKSRFRTKSLIVASLMQYIPSNKFQNSAAVAYRTIAFAMATLLSTVTPYDNFNFELFLPHIRKGVITGISTVMWYAQSAGLEVFNCDDQPFNSTTANYYLYKHCYVPPYFSNEKKLSQTYMAQSMHKEPDLIEILQKILLNNVED